MFLTKLQSDLQNQRIPTFGRFVRTNYIQPASYGLIMGSFVGKCFDRTLADILRSVYLVKCCWVLRLNVHRRFTMDHTLATVTGTVLSSVLALLLVTFLRLREYCCEDINKSLAKR